MKSAEYFILPVGIFLILLVFLVFLNSKKKQNQPISPQLHLSTFFYLNQHGPSIPINWNDR